MNNDIYNERKQINQIVDKNLPNLLKNLNFKKSIFIPHIQNSNTNELLSNIDTSRSFLSNKTSFDLINQNKEKHIKIRLKNDIFLNGEENKNHARRDNFGNEIKKGGKQKIAFADEINVVNSLMRFKNKNAPNQRKIKKYSSSKNLNEEIPVFIGQKRSHTPINSRSSMIQYFFNIYKRNENNKKNLEEFLVNVIEIENLKKETKLNSYSIKKNINIDDDNVCCSCYCFIF